MSGAERLSPATNRPVRPARPRRAARGLSTTGWRPLIEIERRSCAWEQERHPELVSHADCAGTPARAVSERAMAEILSTLAPVQRARAL